MSEALPSGDEVCACGHLARYHSWGSVQGGKVVYEPSRCRVVDCACMGFEQKTKSPEEEEKKRGDEMFRALQADGLTGDVASWLVDLALRVKRLEDKCK